VLHGLSKYMLGAAVKSSRGFSASGRAARLGVEGVRGGRRPNMRRQPHSGSSRPAAALRCYQWRESRVRGVSASSQVRA
jgi:hypothetical protein